MRRFMQWMVALSTIIAPGRADAAGDKGLPDFNFPRDVVKVATTDLEKAMKTNDGQLMVDAIVRYSLAQSDISADNMDMIVDRIHAVADKERRPEYRSMLRYFEACVFDAYKDRVLVDRDVEDVYDDDDLPKGKYATWSRSHIRQHINDLVRESLADKEALLALKVTDYPKIITCNALGASYVPTLYHFMLVNGMKLVNSDYKKELLAEQVAVSEGNNAAGIFAQIAKISNETYGSEENRQLLALYNRYRTIEESGLVLTALDSDDENYPHFLDYVGRFPKSIYTPEVQNAINNIEREQVQVSYGGECAATDSVAVHVTLRNVNDYSLLIYRESDEVASRHYNGKQELKPEQVTLVRTHDFNQVGTVPFDATCDVKLPPLPYGRYVIVPAYKHKGKTQNANKISRTETLLVTDITSMSVTCSESAKTYTLIAVDTHSGKPQQGVTFVDEFGKATAPTGADGITTYVDTTGKSYSNIKMQAVRGDDKYGAVLTASSNFDNNHLTFAAKVLTDLAIYRPGETMRFSAIVYYYDETSRSPLANAEVTATLLDTNRKQVGETLTFTTDAYGRIEGEMEIPTDRLNGTFYLRIGYQGDRWHDHHVEVSEYKTPTFLVEVPSYKAYKTSDPVVLTGKATTYTGLPVGNSTVKLSVARRTWEWRWWRCCPVLSRDDVFFDTTLTTAADGTFSVEIPADKLREKRAGARGCYYNYVMRAQVTNVAGESQEASGGFHIGDYSDLSITTYSSDYNNIAPWRAPLVYRNTDEAVKSVDCTYRVKRLRDEWSQAVLTGTVNTASPLLDLTGLPDGVYMVRFNLDGNTGDEAEAMVTLYRMNATALPDGTVKPLWLPSDGRRVDDRNVAHITIGTSAPQSHIYYVAYGRSKVIARGWLTYKPGMHDFTVKIPDVAEEYLRVRFMSVYENGHYDETVTLHSPINDRKLTVRATAFRDKMTPGDKEKWQFSLLGNGDKPLRGAMMLEMIDKAVNDIAPNTWSFAPQLYAITPVRMTSLQYYSRNSGSASWRAEWLDTHKSDGELPTLNTYDRAIFGHVYRYYDRVNAMGGAVMYKTARMAAPMMEEGMVEMATEDAYESAAMEIAAAEPEVDESRLDAVTMRMADVKTALWMPMLTSNDKGEVVVEFEAPQFNTTWLVQALGYDHNLTTGRMVAEVLTRKPLMVKASLPRFVRQGDKATLAATLQNATDEVTTADAMIELFDPRTGAIYASRKFNETIDPQGMNALTIDWTVPDTIPYVGFRVRAANASFGDGEQMMLPVLEATQPLIESRPFYLNPGDGTATLELPNIPEGARVTLEYSDNPVWYCVTALPSIMTESTHLSTGVAHNLFALSVAGGIARRQPIIKEAFAYWRDSSTKDSTLVSQLSRNRDLKIGSLKASPWLREDERETMRMERLAELMDDSVATATIGTLVGTLADLQLPDGGFAWYKYPGCTSSLWATGTVLELLGEVKHLGYATADERINGIIDRALAYYDKEYVTASKKKENKDAIYSSYAYVRSLHSDVPMGKDAAKLVKNTVKKMAKQWGKSSLGQGEKAFWAMTLHRNGEHKEALRLIESIRQFSINKPQLGTYWDNYGGGAWFSPHQVAVTATVLQAMAEVDPRTDEIDQVRKWMLLSKQTSDWGGGSMAADAVQALLSCGSDWMQRGSRPAVTLDGKPIEFNDFDAFVGYCRTSIDASQASVITVTPDGTHPSWGAVYSQWSQPMATIEADAIDEIAIGKEINVYTTGDKVTRTTELHVGDKVQVRIVITTNREIDYVTVIDERAACFEPKDRFSGYKSQDGVFYYSETKDAQTNLFFDRLPKGTHVFSYDCYVTAPGTFSLGVATAQSQQAAQITAHTAGTTLTVTE